MNTITLVILVVILFIGIYYLTKLVLFLRGIFDNGKVLKRINEKREKEDAKTKDNKLDL